jgi:YD repeat-containing protein
MHYFTNFKKKIIWLLLVILTYSCQLYSQCNAATFSFDVSHNGGTYTSPVAGIGAHTHIWRLTGTSLTNYKLRFAEVYRQSGSTWILESGISASSTNYPSFSLVSTGNYNAEATLTLSGVTQTGTYRVYFEVLNASSSQCSNLCTTLPGKCRLFFTTNVASVACDIPTSLTSSVTTNGATLNWGDALNGSSYVIRYKLPSSTTWTSTSSITSQTTLSGLTCGTQYEWQVRTTCANFGSTSSYTASQFFTTSACPAPTRIISLSPSSLSFGTVNINQSSLSQNIKVCNTGNQLLTISLVSFPAGFSSNWNTANIPANTCVDLPVTFSPTSGTAYAGNIVFTSDATSGSNTVSVSGTGYAPCTTPSMPSNFNASEGNCGYIALSWSGSSGTPSPTYRIFRNSSELGTTTNTYYRDEGQLSGTQNYQVQAFNSCGTSSKAFDTGTMTVTPTCLTPTGLSENASETSATVRWNASTNANNYTVFWRVLGTSDWQRSPPIFTTSHVINALQSNTTYQWYVLTNCDCTVSTAPNEFSTIQTTCATIDGTISRGGDPDSIPSVGDRVQFSFQGYRHATSISWTFPNATPSTSNEATPTVVFNQAGTYIVRLTAGNACGTVNKIDTIKIVDYSGAVIEFQLSDRQLKALDPIGIATGGYLHGERDLTLFGLNNLTFSRNYNSRQISYNKAFGYGWHHNFEYWIDNTSNPDLLTVYHGDGHRVYYVKQPNGTTKLLYDDITDSLIINANATYTLLQRDGGKMNFDASGKATSIEDVFANSVTFGYTANNLTSITSAGRSFRLTYNNNNKIATLSDGQRTTLYGYHPSGDLAYTAISGDTMRYTYNANHELQQVTDPKGYVFVKNVYLNGRVSEQRDAYDTPHYLSYSTLADGTIITTVRDINNATTTAYHNDNFNLIRYIDELGKEQSMTYFPNGALKSYGDQNRHTTDISRNAKGDPLSIKNHLQRSTHTTFNNMGLPTGVTDLLGTKTRFTYNQNRLDSLHLPNGTFIKMTYTPQGLIQNIKDPQGNTVETRTYNAFGDLIQTNTLTGNYYFGQDNLGRITSIRAGEDTRRTWTIEYNHRDQILKMTTPLGTFTQNIYDKNGYVTASKDLTGYWSYYEYDKRDRLTKNYQC